QRWQGERNDPALVGIGGAGGIGIAIGAAAQLAEAEASALGCVDVLGRLRRGVNTREQRQRGPCRGKPSTHRLTPSLGARSRPWMSYGASCGSDRAPPRRFPIPKGSDMASIPLVGQYDQTVAGPIPAEPCR